MYIMLLTSLGMVLHHHQIITTFIVNDLWCQDKEFWCKAQLVASWYTMKAPETPTYISTISLENVLLLTWTTDVFHAFITMSCCWILWFTLGKELSDDCGQKPIIIVGGALVKLGDLIGVAIIKMNISFVKIFSRIFFCIVAIYSILWDQDLVTG